MTAAPLHDTLALVPQGGQAHWISTSDGVRLRLAHWNATAAKGTVFLLPGRTEYIEKYGDAVRHLHAAGYEVMVIDWRGQGLSDRALPDPHKGHVGAMSEYQIDLSAMRSFGAGMHLPQPWFVLSHSMGGAIALRHLIDADKIPADAPLADGAPRFKAAAFSAPMFGISLPAAKVLGALANALSNSPLRTAYAPGTNSRPYVHTAGFADNLLTRAPDMWAMMISHLIEQPALTIAGPTCTWIASALRDCLEMSALPSPDLPALTALGSHERIVETQPIRDRMAAWPKGKLIEFAEGEHEVMMAPKAQRDAFLDQVVALFDAHRG